MIRAAAFFLTALMLSATLGLSVLWISLQAVLTKLAGQ